MEKLVKVITDKIRSDGPIPFKQFMEMALYYPELGYYASPDTRIGREGDFYTSPHLHPVFGAMVGKQLLEMWSFMGRPQRFDAVEVGAGIGYVCNDLLSYLNTPSEDASMRVDKEDFLSALSYTIVEPYDHFREKQTALLKTNNLDGAVSWKRSLADMSEFTGCIFSNELIDAFPVHLIEMHDGLKEVYVNHDGEGFHEDLRPVSTKGISEYLQSFSIDLTGGYRTEVNLAAREWLGTAAELLTRGFLFTIDYGYTAGEYYSEERSRGTLLCYHQHLYNEDPFQNIGEQDITAHVNFTSLKRWGEELGFRTAGYCPQGTYLVSSGIDEVITELYAGSRDYLSEVSKIKGLIMPQGMGETHNVMIQYKGNGTPELRGFAMRNLVESL